MRKSDFFILIMACAVPAIAFAQDDQSPSMTPVSDAVNSQLPSWLRFSGEERARMEYIVGEGFKPVTDLYLLNRLRLNLEVRAFSGLRFYFQSEDSRVFGQNTLPAPASQKDAMDLRLGYMELGKAEGPLVLRAGRQGLDFGDGRVLADPNWSNVGKSFDAARLTLRKKNYKVDLFSAASVKVDPVNFDEPAPGEHFDGAYGSFSQLLPDTVIEPYVFWRLEHHYKNEEGKPGNLDEKTYGLRWAGKLPRGLDYTSETAMQSGSWAGDRIGAWMGRWVVGETLPGDLHRPRFFIEYNRASGDALAKDGEHGTFDSLFPSSHDKFGLTDLFCASNIIHFRPGFQYRVRRSFTLGTGYDNFWLASARDGLYESGKVVVSSPKGTAGTHIGWEADVQAQWTISLASQLNVGYGRLFPGEFLQRTTSGVPYNILFLGMAQRF